MIAHLCNLSISTGIFPTIFKKAEVVPIVKGGDKKTASNYRPISLLSTISKIIEKVVNQRLIDYLESNNFLAENQFGFRRNKSTEDAVAYLSARITDHLDKKDNCVGIFLDLKKAFDTVSISILLARMESLGIRGIVLKWFKSYLSDRSQVVKIGDTYSDHYYNTYGIPQGSTLGPTMFLIYVNELCKINLGNGCSLAFADDTALIFGGNCWSEVKRIGENGIKKVMKWLDDNLLSLNINKTKFICFRVNKKSDPPAHYIIKAHRSTCNNDPFDCGCVSLEQTNTHRYLGIIIDKNLSWHPHITSLSKKVRKLLPVFRNLREAADKDAIKTVYYALCQTILNYCIPVWGGATASHLLDAERAQRAVLKVMLCKDRRFPTVLLYQEAEVLTIRQLYIYSTILRQHKFTDPSEIPQDKRRVKIPIPKTTTNFAQTQLIYRGPFLYNMFNKKDPIYSKNRRSLRSTVTENLKCLEYFGTESILKNTKL
jgi:hypothetical protein